MISILAGSFNPKIKVANAFGHDPLFKFMRIDCQCYIGRNYNRSS